MESDAFDPAPYRDVTGFTPGYAPVPILLPTLAVAFAAFCVWLTVRVVNRRERWAKWTLAAMAIFAVVYPMSLGPVIWIAIKFEDNSWIWDAAQVVYEPILDLSIHGPDFFSSYLGWWRDMAPE